MLNTGLVYTTFITIVCIVFSLTMTFLLYFVRSFAAKINIIDRTMINVIFAIAWYKILAYYFIPSVMRGFSGFQFEHIDHVELLDLAQVYLIELGSWLAWSAGLLASLYFLKQYIYSRSASILLTESINLDRSKLSLLIIVLGYVYFKVAQVLSTSGDESQFAIFEIIKALLSYCGPPAAILLMVLGFKRYGASYGLMGLVGFLTSMAVTSTRGALVYSLLLLIFAVHAFAGTKKNVAVSIFIILSVFLGYIISGGLPTTALSVSDEEGIVIHNYLSDNKKKDRTSLDEIEWRFGAATRLSTSFIKMYDRGDAAGINPIRNSALGFLPRSLNQDKPHPSTLDGNDRYSQGMYLIYREIYGYKYLNMSEFSSGAHAYWEFGWIGVFMLPVISGVYVLLCTVYFQRFGVIGLAFLIGTFKPWGYVDPKMWVSDIIMQIYQMILPIICIHFLIILIQKLKKMFIITPGRISACSVRGVS